MDDGTYHLLCTPYVYEKRQEKPRFKLITDEIDEHIT
jgi:hypothetical protein